MPATACTGRPTKLAQGTRRGHRVAAEPPRVAELKAHRHLGAFGFPAVHHPHVDVASRHRFAQRARRHHPPVAETTGVLHLDVQHPAEAEVLQAVVGDQQVAARGDERVGGVDPVGIDGHRCAGRKVHQQGLVAHLGGVAAAIDLLQAAAAPP